MKKIINHIILKVVSPRKRAEFLRKYIKMGENCEIHGEVSFGSEPYLIKIGNNVRITNGVQFITHDGGVWVLRNNGQLKNADLFGRIEIGDNVHIGINTIIMPNVKIGNNVVIGVGTIVTKDIPDNSVAAGVPAKVIKTLDEYYIKNKDRADFTKDKNQKDKREYLKTKFKL